MNVGIVCDFKEERWYSMDFVADTLVEGLPKIAGVIPNKLCPPMRVRFSGRAMPGSFKLAGNLDRVINRLYEYPRYLREHSGLDAYHVVDHSYAHLVHALPAERTVVTCHDVDTFRCLFAPELEPRSYL